MPLKGYNSLCEKRQKIIVSRDKDGGRSEHRARNLHECYVSHYQIDGEVIKKERPEKRCDFLLFNEDKKEAYLIELKGSDIKKATEQLDSTAEFLKEELEIYRKKFRVVYSGSKTHNLITADIKRFKKQHSDSEFKWGRTPMEEDI